MANITKEEDLKDLKTRVRNNGRRPFGSDSKTQDQQIKEAQDAFDKSLGELKAFQTAYKNNFG